MVFNYNKISSDNTKAVYFSLINALKVKVNCLLTAKADTDTEGSVSTSPHLNIKCKKQQISS